MTDELGGVWLHPERKSSYWIVCEGEVQISTTLKEGDIAVVYRSMDNKIYIRGKTEFTDGRFVDASSEEGPDNKLRQPLLSQFEKENTTLRAIAARVMPCHYCGATDIGLCPYGFPGCSLADDITVYDSLSGAALTRLLKLLKEDFPSTYDYIKVHEGKWS